MIYKKICVSISVLVASSATLFLIPYSVLAMSSANYQVQGQDSSFSFGQNNADSENYKVYGSMENIDTNSTASANYTQRQGFISLITGTGMGGESGATSQAGAGSALLPAPDISNPIFQEIKDNSTQITWVTRAKASSKIIWGKTVDDLSASAEDLSFTTNHLLYVNGLSPLATYFFKIISITESGQSLTSPVYSFTTTDDFYPPSNVVGFLIQAGDSFLTLRWQNPKEADLAGVIIKRSRQFYPANPADGELVFNGLAEFYVDQKLENDTRYFYSIFSYDKKLNYSSGAIANAMPKAKPAPSVEIPPQVPEIAPPLLEIFPATTTKPVIKIEQKTKISINDFDFYIRTANGYLKLSHKAFIEGAMQIIKNSPLTISIPKNQFKEEPKIMVFTIDNSAYLFKENKQTSNYELSILLPDKKGNFDFEILIQDKNGNINRQASKINIDPSGYVFQKIDSNELRINGAKVFLYWLNPQNNEYELWPALSYNQLNPITADETGEYAFYVSSGKYYLKATKDGAETRTEEFEVANEALVNKKIEIKLEEGKKNEMAMSAPVNFFKKQIYGIANNKPLLYGLIISSLVIILIAWLTIRRR